MADDDRLSQSDLDRKLIRSLARIFRNAADFSAAERKGKEIYGPEYRLSRREFQQQRALAPEPKPLPAAAIKAEPAALLTESERRRAEALAELDRTAQVARYRASLLAEYKAATGTTTNSAIYNARNSGIHKPEFYKWRKGELSPNSATTRNFERFLKTQAKPLPRKPRD
jgi:hypothetical protein